ncbi:hypothetical protein TIFTF001_010209 [Ficus carica]|uniref:Uncharacterized protein n=1 Tax=Ficus carica TaxID=3494 RepID=A0AA88ABT5_FICCA|nr:hypothetical protein TIFTF001_010209 [Ficus carica]
MLSSCLSNSGHAGVLFFGSTNGQKRNSSSTDHLAVLLLTMIDEQQRYVPFNLLRHSLIAPLVLIFSSSFRPRCLSLSLPQPTSLIPNMYVAVAWPAFAALSKQWNPYSLVGSCTKQP